MAAGTYERKEFKGGAASTTLAAGINASATTLTLASGTNWPDGSGGPFVIAIDIGEPTEEKLLCSNRTGTTVTVTTRGYDDTTGVSHNIGASVAHVLDASTVDQANRYVNLQTAKGTLVVHNGTNPVEFNPNFVGDGTDDNYVLMGNDAASTGWAFARLETVVSNASAPSVAGYRRIWIDTSSDLVRFSDGSSWVIPSTVASVANSTDRDTLFGGSPSNGTVCYREDFDFLERFTESSWKPATVPKFATTSARNSYYVTPTTGDRAFITSTHAEYQYREDEWILVNRKFTVSLDAPTAPHEGDIWLQPLS